MNVGGVIFHLINAAILHVDFNNAGTDSFWTIPIGVMAFCSDFAAQFRIFWIFQLFGSKRIRRKRTLDQRYRNGIIQGKPPGGGIGITPNAVVQIVRIRIGIHEHRLNFRGVDVVFFLQGKRCIYCRINRKARRILLDGKPIDEIGFPKRDLFPGVTLKYGAEGLDAVKHMFGTRQPTLCRIDGKHGKMDAPTAV